MHSKYVVVIPAKNEERNLPRTLKFLKMQTLKPQEIIVINDGSTDRTRDIAISFGCRVIDIHRRQFDAAGTRILPVIINVGLKLAEKMRPDYISILGADHILPSFITIIS